MAQAIVGGQLEQRFSVGDKRFVRNGPVLHVVVGRHGNAAQERNGKPHQARTVGLRHVPDRSDQSARP